MNIEFRCFLTSASCCLLMVALGALQGCTTQNPSDAPLPLTSAAAGSADQVPVNTLRGPSATTKDNGPPASTVGSPPAKGAVVPRRAVPSAREESAESDSGATGPRREPLFVGWPEPKLVLFITGRQDGYIEPCGCSGLTNQKGGLVRRYTLRKELIERGWEVVPLDVGNQVRRFGRQPEIKFQMTTEGMKQMDYRAIAFGSDDLRLSVGELVALTASDGDQQSNFICANTAVLDPSLTPRYRVIEAAGKKIGVTAVLSAAHQAKITSDEIVKQSPDEALREVWSELDKQDCDLHVLLAHASIDDTIRLAQKSPHFEVVVTAGGAGEPTYEAERIPETDSIMVQVGTKAMYVGIVGVFDDENQPLRYQRVPLDARFVDSREMMGLLKSYQEQLEGLGLSGLGVKSTPHPSGRKFVGSDECKDCHEDEYEIWENTLHAHALDSLVHPGERSEVPRHFDPECISCHVVGWNPQKFFPYTSGYLGLDETPEMHNVGCENCHGPGSAHVDAEVGIGDPTDELLEKLQAEMRLELEDAEVKCMECHDLDNSPDFHVEGAFEKYWEDVEH